MLSVNSKSGFSIVEIVVAAAVFVSTLAIFVVAFEFLNDIAYKTEYKTQAALLLEEGSEAMLILRDLDWQNIASLNEGDEYYLYWDGSNYRLEETQTIIASRFLRTVEINPAYRNASGVLVDSGTDDPDTKRVYIRVLNDSTGEVLVTSEMLIHNSYE